MVADRIDLAAFCKIPQMFHEVKDTQSVVTSAMRRMSAGRAGTLSPHQAFDIEHAIGYLLKAKWKRHAGPTELPQAQRASSLLKGRQHKGVLTPCTAPYAVTSPLLVVERNQLLWPLVYELRFIKFNHTGGCPLKIKIMEVTTSLELLVGSTSPEVDE